MKVHITNESAFDYIKKIKSNSVDLVLIDPPYEISQESGFLNGKETGTDTDRFRRSLDFGEWDKNFTGLDIIIKEAYRILKPSGTLICFYDLWKLTNLASYFKEAKFKQLRFIEWIKTNPVPINSKTNYLSNAREIALLGIKGKNPIYHGVYDNGIYNFPIESGNGRFHPTQKPLNLIKALIEKHSNEDDTVVDVFSGSATTAVASIQTKRNFLGCELDSNYFEQSISRIRNLNNPELILDIQPIKDEE